MKNRNLALWIGVLGGPLCWLSSFEARFVLVPWACTFQSKLALFSVALVAIALCAACALLSWNQWKELGEKGPSAEGGALPRSNFMAIGGMVLSTGCCMVLIAQTIPDLLLGACQ